MAASEPATPPKKTTTADRAPDGTGDNGADPAPETRPDAQPAAVGGAAEPPLPEGDWLIADAPLYLYNPDAGQAPVRAHNPGDRVHRSAVLEHGWHDLVSVPEWATAPPAPATESPSEGAD